MYEFLTLLNQLATGSPNEITAEDLNGAWENDFVDENGDDIRLVSIITDGYYAATAFKKDDGEFLNTNGGMIDVRDGRMYFTYEFNVAEPEKVGQTEDFGISLNGDMIEVEGMETTWMRIDDGKPGELNGAWLITGRRRDGELSRSTPGERKTMKILSGTRFQWIAYHTGNSGFFGTGGGTYTTENGKYTENIEFFSRDKTRAGASLVFDYELIDGEWHHSGLSSTGNPIYEIWTRRTDL
ncbi:MAG: membrane or secreted protein [Cyclobacteriaceae bacterium]